MKRISEAFKAIRDILWNYMTRRLIIGKRSLTYSSLIYIALITAGFLILPGFLGSTADRPATIAVCAFAIAIPLQVMCLLIYRTSERIELQTLMFPGSFQFLGQLSMALSYVGVVATFWHVSMVAGIVFLVVSILTLLYAVGVFMKLLLWLVPEFVQNIGDESGKENFLRFLEESRAKVLKTNFEIVVKIDVELAEGQAVGGNRVDGNPTYWINLTHKEREIFLFLIDKSYDFSIDDKLMKMRGYLQIGNREMPNEVVSISVSDIDAARTINAITSSEVGVVLTAHA